MELKLIPVIDIRRARQPRGLLPRGRRGERVFDIAASFEMEHNAIETLQLRSAVRRLSTSPVDLYKPYVDFLNSREPDERAFKARSDIAKALEEASDHVHEFELGEKNRSESDALIRRALPQGRAVGLDRRPALPGHIHLLDALGGRTMSRSARITSTSSIGSTLSIIESFRPSVFVMENVKGLLSATHSGRGIFRRILDDLSLGGRYQIDPSWWRGMLPPGTS